MRCFARKGADARSALTILPTLTASGGINIIIANTSLRRGEMVRPVFGLSLRAVLALLVLAAAAVAMPSRVGRCIVMRVDCASSYRPQSCVEQGPVPPPGSACRVSHSTMSEGAPAPSPEALRQSYSTRGSTELRYCEIGGAKALKNGPPKGPYRDRLQLIGCLGPACARLSLQILFCTWQV